LIASAPSHVVWISKTNGDSPASVDLVASGLNYHFCAHPEFFHAFCDSPLIFYTLVGADVVKFLLIRIGVFAIDGIIFRIHHSRQAAALDVGATLSAKTAGKNSNFEMAKGFLAQQQPGSQPIHLPDNAAAAQLASMTTERMCQPELPGDENKGCAMVKKHFIS
jgi:hypothetical protein